MNRCLYFIFFGGGLGSLQHSLVIWFTVLSTSSLYIFILICFIDFCLDIVLRGLVRANIISNYALLFRYPLYNYVQWPTSYPHGLLEQLHSRSYRIIFLLELQQINPVFWFGLFYLMAYQPLMGNLFPKLGPNVLIIIITTDTFDFPLQLFFSLFSICLL